MICKYTWLEASWCTHSMFYKGHHEITHMPVPFKFYLMFSQNFPYGQNKLSFIKHTVCINMARLKVYMHIVAYYSYFLPEHPDSTYEAFYSLKWSELHHLCDR